MRFPSQNVTKNLPRVIHSSLAIVMVILLGEYASHCGFEKPC